MGKKSQSPPKGSTCALRFSQYPSRMDPIPIPLVAVSPGFDIIASTVHPIPVYNVQHVKCH